MSKPRLLDLFAGAGGAARGYQQAGFHVTGVDINPQPRYAGDLFVQGDALRPPVRLEDFDVIHASPPCQAHTTAGNGWKSRLGPSDERHENLIPPTRDLLAATGLPYIIENVPELPLVDYVVVCGLALGLNVKRHRWFESNVPLMVPPCRRHDEDFVIVFGGGVRGRTHQIGRTRKGAGGPILRRPTLSLRQGRDAMGIDWMDRYELSQAIPPAYTQLLGSQILALTPAKEGSG